MDQSDVCFLPLFGLALMFLGSRFLGIPHDPRHERGLAWPGYFPPRDPVYNRLDLRVLRFSILACFNPVIPVALWISGYVGMGMMFFVMFCNMFAVLVFVPVEYQLEGLGYNGQVDSVEGEDVVPNSLFDEGTVLRMVYNEASAAVIRLGFSENVIFQLMRILYSNGAGAIIGMLYLLGLMLYMFAMELFSEFGWVG